MSFLKKLFTSNQSQTQQEPILEAPQSASEKTKPAIETVRIEVQVVDQSGLHARPATLLAKAAMQYKDTEINLSHNDVQVSLKSMIKIMSLGITHNSTVIVSAEGPQAQTAAQELASMIKAGLDNDQENANNTAQYNPLKGLSPLKSPTGRLVFTGAAASPGIAAARPIPSCP